MKYVRDSRGKPSYQRDYPARLQKLIRKKTFTCSLGPAGQTEAQLLAAIGKATELYTVKCRMATNSDPLAYTDSETAVLAMSILKGKDLKEGQLFRDYPVDPEITTLEQSNHEYNKVQLQGIVWDEDDSHIHTRPDYLQVTPHEVAALAFHDEMIDDQHRRREGLPETIQQKAAGLAYLAALEQRKKQPTYLSQLWDLYIKGKRGGTVDRAVHNQWSRYMTLTGEQIVGVDSDRSYLNKSLREYRDHRRNEDLKEASIKRELANIVACLNWSSRENDWSWHVVRPSFNSEAAAQKEVISQDEQLELVHSSLRTGPALGPVVTILLGLHGGIISSEIRRMDLKAQMHCLNSEVPHVVISGITKTTARPRYIPIVYGLDIIRAGIKDAIELNQKGVSSANAVKKLLKATRGHPYVPYCLRHTMRFNFDVNGVTPSDTALLGGWAGGATADNQVMLGYGAAGAGSVVRLTRLADVQRVAQGHLVQFFD